MHVLRVFSQSHAPSSGGLLVTTIDLQGKYRCRIATMSFYIPENLS